MYQTGILRERENGVLSAGGGNGEKRRCEDMFCRFVLWIRTDLALFLLGFELGF